MLMVEDGEIDAAVEHDHILIQDPDGEVVVERHELEIVAPDKVCDDRKVLGTHPVDDVPSGNICGACGKTSSPALAKSLTAYWLRINKFHIPPD